MQLHVKNMVCDRCILIVRQQLENLGFSVSEISLGKVTVSPDPDPAKLQDISSAFQVLGFELIDKDKDQLVEQVKTQVIELVHYSNLFELKQSLMSIIADKLNKEYVYLSRLFSDVEGITIEKYIIQQKVTRVKELLEYGELNLNEIAYQMGYSSSAHLSTQFKAVTGLTPSKYKAQPGGDRKPLDRIS
ncbi:AraC family transcriptional regulator [Pedobacter lusitanus]|uniref:AraC family transcriptional regulator n=1 Tax=Pedobacter lusitanus TaxID=1503925 RepID=A0A0D0EZ60_9SPHI|nr:AraC family transcriptional regulator [Pedobacter lusitanus]KIO74673.1 AraC family transcriptional regulator [Pedobacter lusitanus]